MAIYHLEATVISRGTGRSAVAAAAYMSCSKIYNDYDGVQHDYTRKQGLVWQIKADSALLRELKLLVQNLTELVRGGVAAIAEAMENLCQRMVVFRY